MVNATDLKAGVTFLHDGKPYQVIKYSLIKMGRGGATVKLNVRNIETGSNELKAFSSNIALDEVSTTKRKLQYLYNDGVNAVFMDPKTFDQVEIPLTVVGTQIKFIKEGSNVDVLFWDPSSGSGASRALSVELTPKVTLTVVETDPGVKGNSATNMYKSAVLENGLNIKVPLFIETGEKIVVDTRTGDYIERAKSN